MNFVYLTVLADIVMAYLTANDDSAHDEVYVETYHNGRENGYALNNFNTSKKIVFSEYRNTDQLVVYVGDSNEFSDAGNTPSDAAWQSRKFFDNDNLESAAQFILDELRGKDE